MRDGSTVAKPCQECHLRHTSPMLITIDSGLKPYLWSLNESSDTAVHLHCALLALLPI